MRAEVNRKEINVCQEDGYRVTQGERAESGGSGGGMSYLDG